MKSPSKKIHNMLLNEKFIFDSGTYYLKSEFPVSIWKSITFNKVNNFFTVDLDVLYPGYDEGDLFVISPSFFSTIRKDGTLRWASLLFDESALYHRDEFDKLENDIRFSIDYWFPKLLDLNSVMHMYKWLRGESQSDMPDWMKYVSEYEDVYSSAMVRLERARKVGSLVKRENPNDYMYDENIVCYLNSYGYFDQALDYLKTSKNKKIQHWRDFNSDYKFLNKIKKDAENKIIYIPKGVGEKIIE